MPDTFSTAIQINASPAEVWAALTNPERMTQWMGEPEMNINVLSNWQVNTPVIIRGFHHVAFENKGVVLQNDNEKTLRYTQLSSVSRLPDKPENYSIFEFSLTPIDEQTLLTLHIEGFPTETIRKHLEFYWKTTMTLLQASVEAINVSDAA
ncbi:SRPBCC domain-containing protein [Spirosoma sp. BT702]|uniref:SRPBCC domain-containing protein n=1 Tax=Spirosoma profusum TaxID=2771354 RepID=A0A927AM83_9BACT|nr:SRPBCC domain-containing protein [Spirosoma profusum]MBD2699269.1 SRPBCC domain-containing protein [Spirosoma profusum]